MNDYASKITGLTICCSHETNIIDLLTNLGDSGKLQEWRVEPFGIPGGFEYCLTNGLAKVAISNNASIHNVAYTSNVLPFDISNDFESANDVINQLMNVLSYVSELNFSFNGPYKIN